MAEGKTGTRKPAKQTAGDAFSEAEREAMADRAREAKAAKSGKVDGEADVLAAIAKLGAEDRAIAERIHVIVKAAVPTLVARTWYGMPAYARDGKVMCFFQSAGKFKARYATLGFSDEARLDDGAMWPTSYALSRLGPDEEARITRLVQQAAGG